MVNGQLVMRFGMHRLTRRALYAVTVLSWVLLSLSGWFAGHPPLFAFMAVLVGWFFCMGVVFGNINAMAMEPLGHVAGSAAAVICPASTLMAVGLGYLVGGAYDGTLLPMAVGGLLFGLGMVIGGYCPGTAIASLATGKLDALVFIVGFLIGYRYQTSFPQFVLGVLLVLALGVAAGLVPSLQAQRLRIAVALAPSGTKSA